MKRNISDIICALSLHKLNLKSCKVCKEVRVAKRREIIDKGFNDILDVLGRYHR